MRSITFLVLTFAVLVFSQSEEQPKSSEDVDETVLLSKNGGETNDALISNYGSSVGNAQPRLPFRRPFGGNYGYPFNYYGSSYPYYGYYPSYPNYMNYWNYFIPYYPWNGNNHHHHHHNWVRSINFKYIMSTIRDCAKVIAKADVNNLNSNKEYLRCRELLREFNYLNATEILVTQCKLNYTNQEYDATRELKMVTQLRDKKLREIERYESSNPDRYFELITKLKAEVEKLNAKIDDLNLDIILALKELQKCDKYYLCNDSNASTVTFSPREITIVPIFASTTTTATKTTTTTAPAAK